MRLLGFARFDVVRDVELLEHVFLKKEFEYQILIW